MKNNNDPPTFSSWNFLCTLCLIGNSRVKFSCLQEANIGMQNNSYLILFHSLAFSYVDLTF